MYVTRDQFEQIFKNEDLKMFTENIKMQTLLSSGNTKDISKNGYQFTASRDVTCKQTRSPSYAK